MSENNAYLTTDEVAKLLHTTRITLRGWRRENRGPAFIKMGGARSRVLYPRDALDEWLRANTVIPKNH